VLLTLLRQHPAPPLDTSADGVFRRAGTPPMASLYRERIVTYLPVLVPTLGAIAATWPALRIALRRGGVPRAPWFFAGVAAAWIAVTVGALIALLAGSAIPGHRLIGLCLPIPVAAGIGLAALLDARGGRYPRLRVDLTLLCVAGLLVALTAVQFALADPIASDEEVRTAAAAARWSSGIGNDAIVADATPPAEKTVEWAIARLNVLRDVFPVRQIPGIRIEVGPMAAQVPSDVARRSVFGGARSIRENDAIALTTSALDPRLVQRGSGRIVVPGVALLSGRPERVAPTFDVEGIAPFAPWAPMAVGLVLFALVTAIGWPLAASAAPASGRWATLAPALGIADVSIWAMALAAAGLRLDRVGGLVALVAASGTAIVLAAVARRTSVRPTTRRPLPD
jgi:hypothetical protein